MTKQAKIFPKKPFDSQQYNNRVKKSPCFICQIVSKNPEFYHNIIYEDQKSIVFLNKYPVLYGYVLVAPKDHIEQVTGEISLEDYLHLQKIIYFTSESIKQVVITERMYILSAGSQQGNSHIHWHIVPLPPNIPYEKQQFEAIRFENGIIDISEEEMEQLSKSIKQVLKQYLPVL